MTCARHANVFQHLIIDLGEQVSVDVVGFEGVGILGETDLLEPIPYCDHCRTVFPIPTRILSSAASGAMPGLPSSSSPSLANSTCAACQIRSSPALSSKSDETLPVRSAGLGCAGCGSGGGPTTKPLNTASPRA